MAISSEFLDENRKRGVCFFGYRIPGRGGRFGSAFAHDCSRRIERGFVIQPFRPDELPVTIPFGTVSGAEENDEMTLNFPYYSTAKSFYRKHAGEIIEYLRRNPDHKVVYSRVLVQVIRRTLSEIFDALCEKYPKAYVFCYYTPWTGLWIGASPELLAGVDGSYFRTMALAGTMDVNKGGAWSEKNKREQGIVANFIRDILNKADVEEIMERNSQRIAGPVKHLMTEFTVKLSEDSDFRTKAIVKELSPTPALAGYPRDKALGIIAAHEAYPRGCYGGFCGPCYGHRNCEYWVNLRSMRILNDTGALYIGSGLMPDSEIDAEWEETEKKAATLLQII